MTAPFYVGTDVPVRFAVLDKGKPLYPISVSVAVFDPIGSLVAEGQATVSKNTVSYILSHDVTGESGTYTIVFMVRLFNLGIMKNVMEVEIHALPTGKEKKEVSDTFEVADHDEQPVSTWEVPSMGTETGRVPVWANQG